MAEKIIAKIISELVPILPTLLSVFIGGILGFISTFIIDWKKASREKEQYNRTKKEDAYLECIKILITINVKKENAFNDIDEVIRTRSKIDLYGSEEVKESYRNIADNILNGKTNNNEESITKLIEKMRKELEIKD